MNKKILVVYYSQTGQLTSIVNSVMAPVTKNDDITVVYEVLRPIPPFPFPWSSDAFFQAMPESVKGIPCMLEPLSFDDKTDFDLIIIAYQPWFLSPSIPYHAFFKNEKARKII
ncbi:TPA: dialkylresorcinol condensing enzyme, partial [bacterium]|nr:dialkylresorcinol condensing enzyme [bacterium]